MGFPGFMKSDNEEKIEGMLFSSEELQSFWPILDTFEGDDYQRILISVILEDNRNVDAFIYALNE